MCLFLCALNGLEPEENGLYKAIQLIKTNNFDIDQMLYKKLVYIERATCIGVKCDDQCRKNLLQFLYEISATVYRLSGGTQELDKTLYEPKQGKMNEVEITDEWIDKCENDINVTIEATRSRMKDTNITLQAVGLAANEVAKNVKEIVNEIEEGLKNSRQEELSNLDSFKMCMTQLAGQLANKIAVDDRDVKRIYSDIYNIFAKILEQHESKNIKRDDIYAKMKLLPDTLSPVFRKNGDQNQNIAHFVDKICDGIERFLILNQNLLPRFDQATKKFFENLSTYKTRIKEFEKNFKFRIAKFQEELEKDGVNEVPAEMKKAAFSMEKPQEQSNELGDIPEFDGLMDELDSIEERPVAPEKPEKKPKKKKEKKPREKVSFKDRIAAFKEKLKNKNAKKRRRRKRREYFTFYGYLVKNSFGKKNNLYIGWWIFTALAYLLFILSGFAMLQEFYPVDNLVLAKIYTTIILMVAIHGIFLSLVGLIFCLARTIGTVFDMWQEDRYNFTEIANLVLMVLLPVCMFMIGVVLFYCRNNYMQEIALPEIVVAQDAESLRQAIYRIWCKITLSA